MREIKFRVWDISKNEMYQVVTMEFNKATGEISFKEYPIMQYTGLLDKNYKEIYEGDIVRAKGHADIWNDNKYFDHSGVIEWIDVDACFAVQTGHKEIFTIGRFDDGVKIIGNIYENPELLKGGD